MEAKTLEPGTLIDRRYTIRRFIASGGIAHVYEAVHRVTGREVAVKLPRSDRGQDPSVHERLLREGQALSQARHPGVVELLDGGDHEGAPYLVLELLEGRTLGGLLAARGKLAWEEGAHVGMKVAEIVQHCHERGVIHRDLKPDNLFALPASAWSVKLFDFGIARLRDTTVAEDAQKLTQAGSILGTPEYMAPEALELDGSQDHRIDIYSLGVMLFELLTGSVPFEGRYADVLVQVSTKPLPPLAELRPDLPAALLQAVVRCLAKDPHERYPSMAAVAGDLKEALGSRSGIALGASTAADQVSPPGEAGVPAPKHTLADTPGALKTQSTAGKRRFPRAPYTTPAELRLANGEAIAGRVEEISEGGVQFIAARGVPSGERGEFRFAEPITGRVLKVTATSRWTKEARGARHATGFEFEGAPEEARAAIRKYVELMGGN